LVTRIIRERTIGEKIIRERTIGERIIGESRWRLYFPATQRTALTRIF
jgi:hypothetical protein